MSNKKRVNSEILSRFIDSADSDIFSLEAFSDEEVEDLLRSEGFEPKRAERPGLALIHDILDRRRLSWMDEADAKISQMRTKVNASVQPSLDLSRVGILSRLREIMGEGQLAFAFRDRKEDSFSDEELRELLLEAEQAKTLSAETDGEDDPTE